MENLTMYKNNDVVYRVNISNCVLVASPKWKTGNNNVQTGRNNTFSVTSAGYVENGITVVHKCIRL